MLRVMVADDEKNARDSMIRYIDKKKYGIHIVGAASDGEEACRLIQEHRPDIVLIDIEMPVMSGLQVIDKVYNQYGMSSVVFIIVSSYDKFSYAHEAIRLGVNDYLLKPFMPSDICDAIYRAAKHIEYMRTLSMPRGILPGETGAPDRSGLSLLAGTHIAMDYPYNEEQRIIQFLQAGDAAGISKALDDFFACLPKTTVQDGSGRQSSPEDITWNCLTILYIEICHFAIMRKLNLENIQLPEDVRAVPEAFCQALRTFTASICQILNDEKQSNAALQLAVRYIHEHYAESLTLEQVANVAFVSPTYLSTLFSQQLDIHFVDYIHKVRIEKSLLLMRENPQLKYYEIGERVGYASYKHYATCFKKVMHITVSEYVSRMR